MSLTFVNDNSGIPIAKITSKSKDLDKKIWYFNDKGKVNNNSLVPTYDELKLKNDSDKFQLMPSDKTRSIFCSGMQGIGKSYWIGAYLKQYQKLHKDAKIIIFSEKDHDVAIDDQLKNITRVPIDSTLLDNPITKEELNDQPEYTMFVFDDVDGIEIRLRREVYRLLNVLINVYRSKKLNIIFSSHKSCDVSWTSTALQGCDVLVFFHRNYNRNVEYLVREYINKKEVKNFEKGLYNNSRYCCFIKTYPSLMLFEDQIKIC